MPYLASEYDDLDKYTNEFETIFYYKKNTLILHNPYGPAVVNKNGYKEYRLEGNLHRLDGSAVIYSGSQEQYCINGKVLTKEKFEKHPERLKFLGKEYLTCLI